MKAVLIHDYNFASNGCIDLVGGSSWNCKMFNGAYISNGELILNNPNSYIQLPKGILNSSNSISIEIVVSTGSSNTGWCRILQFGLNANSNLLSFSIDRIASNYNNNNRPGNIMLEYFPRNYQSNDIDDFQAYSDTNFNNQKNIRIIASLSFGNKLNFIVNRSTFKSLQPIPYDSNANSNIFYDDYSYIGKSLDPHQDGFIGSVSSFKIWQGILPDNYINNTSIVTSNPTSYPTNNPTKTPSISSSFTPIKPPSLCPTLIPSLRSSQPTGIVKVPTSSPTAGPIISQPIFSGKVPTSPPTAGPIISEPIFSGNSYQPSTLAPSIRLSSSIPSFKPSFKPSTTGSPVVKPSTVMPTLSNVAITKVPSLPITASTTYPTLVQTRLQTKPPIIYLSILPSMTPSAVVQYKLPVSETTIIPTKNVSTDSLHKVKTDLSSATYRNALIGIGCIVVVLIIAIIIYIRYRVRKHQKLEQVSNEWTERQFLRLGAKPDDDEKDEITNQKPGSYPTSNHPTSKSTMLSNANSRSVRKQKDYDYSDNELASMINNRVAVDKPLTDNDTKRNRRNI